MPFSRSAFSGFPFDRDFDRDRGDDSFRSQLDDIAQRHPELAEHLEGFPFRSDSLGRRSRPPRPSDESAEFRRFAGRPFGSGRFERFGFPFGGRDPFEDDEFTPRQEEPHKPTQESPPPPPPPEEKRERGRRQNIQPSNTVDLGQKQEPVVDDNRNQRSMSAPPPDNRSGQQRYVSSINIPINRDGGIGESKPQPPPPQQQQQSANKPTERVIPIHVEGRDEPVLPKHAGPSFSQVPPPPQPERIFGHRPERFTQYVGREPPRQFAAGPEWHHPAYTKQQEVPPPTETMRQQKFQQQQQVPVQKPQEQVPPPQQQQQPQPKPSSNNTPIDLIQSIQKDVSALMEQVEKFSGMPKDKEYLYLDEMLTRNLIKLDNIDTQGQENIRQARKEAIKCIEKCIGVLEAKAAANVPKDQAKEEEKMDVESTTEQQLQSAESQSTTTEEKPTENQQTVAEEKMEIETNKESDNVSEKTEVVEEKTEEPKQQSNEDKMEVQVEAAVEQAKVEEKLNECNESEKVEDKSGNVEATSTTQEEGGEATNQENKTEDDNSSDEKKEKKKGKKKVVKK